jgi:hypothetical protein
LRIAPDGRRIQYIERVLAFSFISNKYLLTVHQEHLSVYDLSKKYPRFNRLDPSTTPLPVYQLVLPEACHAAGLHRSGSLDHVPGPPLVPPPLGAADILPASRFTSEADASNGGDDEGAAWEGKDVPFYEDPSRNILAVNLISYASRWPRTAGTVGTTIIIPLQRLVDFAEETVAKSTADIARKIAKHAKAQVEALGNAAARMYSELGGAQPLGILRHYPVFELARLERRRPVELIRAGLSATTTTTTALDPTRLLRKPRCFQPAQWLKHALVFHQETHGRPYDYRRSIVSGSRFVSGIEVREGKRLFQLIEFNPTWVNALEQRLAHPARDVGVHYEAVECGNPMLRLVQQNWETEGLIVPMIFGEHVAADSDEDSVYGFPDVHFGSDDEECTFPPPPSPVTPALTPILSPSSPIEPETNLRLAEVDPPEPSWYGWRVARCGEVKYAWKAMQAGRNIIALDVAIQEDSLIYTAVSVCMCCACARRRFDGFLLDRSRIIPRGLMCTLRLAHSEIPPCLSSRKLDHSSSLQKNCLPLMVSFFLTIGFV